MNKLNLIFYGHHPKQEYWPRRTQLFNLQIKPEKYNDRTKVNYNPSVLDNWVNITLSLIVIITVITMPHRQMLQTN